MIIGGKYEVERVLGEGGMGLVYLAKHVDLGRHVAVKVLRGDAVRDKEVVERFRREARVAASLKSAHVAKILDFGTLDDGAPFMVMEHLDGNDLDEELVRRGALPVAEAVGYLLEVCDAIKEAHQRGVVHRDLKPGNIFLANDGGRRVAKVLDFGISKLVADENVRMTRTQSSFGTPLYMSPEHMRSVKNVDHRTDLWSLGIILYEAVTGRVPFEAETATAVAVAVATEPLVPPSKHRPGLPPALDEVVAHALEKDPARRFQSIDELATALAPLASWGGTLAAMPRRSTAAAAETSAALTTGRVAASTQRKTPVAAYLVGAIALGAAVGGAIFFGAASGGKGAATSPTATASTSAADPTASTPTEAVVKEPAPEASGSPTEAPVVAPTGAPSTAPSASAARLSPAGKPAPQRPANPATASPKPARSAPPTPTVKKSGGDNPLLL